MIVTMSKYVKNLITEHLADALDGRQRRPAGEHGRPERQRQLPAAGGAAQARTSRSWWSRTAWRPGDGRDAAGADVRGLSGAGGRVLGQRGHRQPGQGDYAARQRRQVQAVRSPRGRDGRRSSSTPTQVEQVSKWPSRDRAIEHPAGPDSQAGRAVGEPVEPVGGALASQIEREGQGPEEQAAAAAAAGGSRGSARRRRLSSTRGRRRSGTRGRRRSGTRGRRRSGTRGRRRSGTRRPVVGPEA